MAKQRLIDANAMLKRLEEWNTTDSMDKALYNFTLCRINEQPTIELERKTEKWIERDQFHIECPFCHSVWADFENRIEYFYCCPCCGTRLVNGDV